MVCADGGLGKDGLSAEVAAGPLPDFKWRTDLLLPTASVAELEPVSLPDAAVLERWETQLAAAAASKAARDTAAAEAAASPPPAVLPSPTATPGLAQGSGSGSTGARGAVPSPASMRVNSPGGGVDVDIASPAQATADHAGMTAAYGLASKRVRASLCRPARSMTHARDLSTRTVASAFLRNSTCIAFYRLLAKHASLDLSTRTCWRQIARSRLW